jgi:hypothetical protein
VFYIPLFLGSATTLILWTFCAFRNNEQCDQQVTVLLSMVLAFSAMHARLQVDYGWRYRVPIFPCLMMRTTIAVHTAIKYQRQQTIGMSGRSNPGKT